MQDHSKGPDLSHQQAILINLGSAMVGSCPGDCHMVPRPITRKDAGNRMIAILEVAADVVWVRPE